MWYAITGGSGLLLGLGLLIWGLRERSKRHAAERAADKARAERLRYENAAKHSAKIAAEAESEAARVNNQFAALRQRLAGMRERLARCGDPDEIRAWLDDEMKAEDL
jgi:alkanesulfonate monooxygenase SsuD/methylene tetrahydromethanopterin reductase-like flavin-dependent oxidoreductase (luciferase family)